MRERGEGRKEEADERESEKVHTHEARLRR